MNCKDLEQPEILVDVLRKADKNTENSIYYCFEKLYYDFCIKYAHTSIFIRYSFYPANKEELLNDSFEDAYIVFFRYISKNGYSKKAKVQTAFCTFFKRVLWRNIERLNKHNDGLDKGDPEITIGNLTNTPTEDPLTIRDIFNELEKRDTLFGKAFLMLGERCQKLIRWRCLENISIEEIAERLGMEKKTVSSEIDRCKNRLKNNIKGLE